MTRTDMSTKRPSHPSRARARVLRGGFVALAGLGAVALSAGTALAADPTTVTPAGAYFSATATTSATFTVGGVTVTCDTSATTPTQPLGTDAANQVPAQNSNPDGTVSSAINPPTFEDCTTNIPLVSAVVTTSGSWTIAAQGGASPTASLVLPQGGLVVQTSGLASCRSTAAPDAPATVTGAWANGDPATLTFSGVSTPVETTGGFGCPTAEPSAAFSAVYEVANETDPATPIAIQ
ncbi:hypothetical protein HNR12_003427 [Streptomonospora nanhaiensis]|uniref:Ig-like domain-containing protein n=1 Tax=Streptomonospora nanhaiensis TaxID=1323731 RepID=A0A853BQ70_9ACTN|nr:hypothetical protein [Streptomonospora nanhaiensis]NYI97150.1 hypothetical protein [Streptomonospora nanhaiensis]